MKLLTPILLFFLSFGSLPHGGEDHSKKKTKKVKMVRKKPKKEDKLENKPIKKPIVKKQVSESMDKAQQIEITPPKVIEISDEDILRKKYQQINTVYVKKIKPIFKKSCFDCHGVVQKYPWYYKIPGVKRYIDYDIAESKKHIELTNDFPFMSHASPIEDLKAIGKTVKEGSMPPFRYWIMHRNTRLTKKEKKMVNDWVVESIGILND